MQSLSKLHHSIEKENEQTEAVLRVNSVPALDLLEYYKSYVGKVACDVVITVHAIVDNASFIHMDVQKSLNKKEQT